MKCKNCGANFPLKELNCPYCGATNIKGWVQKRDKERAEAEYESASKVTAVILRKRMANCLLNRTFAAEVIVGILLAVGIVVTFYLQDVFINMKHKYKADELQVRMEELYSQESFSELYDFIQKNHFYNDENRKYTQAARLYFEYNDFEQARMNYYSKKDELKEYEAESLVWNIHKVLDLNNAGYEKLTEENRAICDRYTRDAEVFATVVLGFDENQMQLLKQDHLKYEEQKQLAEDLLQRGAHNAE